MAGSRKGTHDGSAAGAADKPSSFYASETSFGRLVFFLSRSYQTYLDDAVSPFGISSAHVPLLIYLWSGGAGDTQNDIARYLAVDKGTVSRNVAALVRLGLVTQTSSVRDSRACVVELTDEGWKLAEPIAALSQQWSEGVVVDLGAPEREALLGELKRMCERAESLADPQEQSPRLPAAVLPRVATPNAASAGVAEASL